MVTQSDLHDKSSLVQKLQEIVQFVRDAAVQGLPEHEVEKFVYVHLLGLGHDIMNVFFQAQGNGDLGPSLELADGTVVHRHQEEHSRELTTVFGKFMLHRTVYSAGPKRKLHVPLDERLSLPESKFSYLLQQFDQMLAVEQPYQQVSKVIEAIFQLRQNVDSLERMSRSMSIDCENYCWSVPAPPAQEEGELLVRTADGKGVPIRREDDSKPIENHQAKTGPKPERKRMATLGAIYTVDRHRRTVQEVLEALFRDPKEKPQPKPARPEPQHKLTYARMDDDPSDPDAVHGLTAVMDWLEHSTQQRLEHRDPAKTPVITIMDGQPSLWDSLPPTAASQHVQILDLLHVTPRIWQAAKLLLSDEADQQDFVYRQVERVLNGQVKSVNHSIRSLATRRAVSGRTRRKLEVICRYFEKNQHRMRYDQYLHEGYPIASGVIEGACRHVVKDRLERTGMSWTRVGAQAMLGLRAIYTSDHWDPFMKYRIEQEQSRIHPQRELINSIPWPIAA